MRKEDSSTPWWERRTTMVALTLLSIIPLVWPDVPPMVDLPGHMGRYRVQLDLAASPFLKLWYSFHWALIGNLGIDLLIEPMSRLFGLELGVKLIIAAIPPMTVAGFLWVAREVHGRIPPTAMFALPLAYCFPFIFGFANFALSMGMAFLAFGLWLRMARTGHLRLRAILFVPISGIIWVTHAFGWGTLGVLAFSAELIRQMDRGQPVIRAWFLAGIHCLPLAPPVLLMLLWRGQDGGGGQTGDWFNWRAKISWFAMVLRDRWLSFDMLSLAVLIIVMLDALRDKRLTFSRNLAISALFLLAVYIILPRIVFGSAYADMRLAPYMVAVAVLAIRPKPETPLLFRRSVAFVALAFFLIRMGGATASFWLFDRTYQTELAALDTLPRGARLLSFVGKECRQPWMMHRLEHLPGFALVRREAFSNDQWVAAGAQLLRTHFPTGWRYSRDPSQIVTWRKCRGEVWWPLNRSLAHMPRERFDYVWMIQPPRYDPRLVEGMTEIWRSGSSVLWRIDDRAAPIAAEDYPIPQQIRVP